MKTNETRRTPAVDVFEATDAWTCVFDLPGCQKEDVDISVADGRLTLEARPRKPDMPASAVVQRCEAPAAAFGRTITLDAELDASKATARLDRGVLTLRIPKRAEAQEEKKIRIE